MDLADAMLELADDMEKDLTTIFETPGDHAQVVYYTKLIREMVVMSRPKSTHRDEDGGASVSIGGSTQPQQPTPPSRPFKASRKPSDPWEEARRRAAFGRRSQESQSDPGDEDSEDHE